jgi:hypothetical protein
MGLPLPHWKHPPPDRHSCHHHCPATKKQASRPLRGHALPTAKPPPPTPLPAKPPSQDLNWAKPKVRAATTAPSTSSAQGSKSAFLSAVSSPASWVLRRICPHAQRVALPTPAVTIPLGPLTCLSKGRPPPRLALCHHHSPGGVQPSSRHLTLCGE